jgi:hypothetical protein
MEGNQNTPLQARQLPKSGLNLGSGVCPYLVVIRLHLFLYFFTHSVAEMSETSRFVSVTRKASSASY